MGAPRILSLLIVIQREEYKILVVGLQGLQEHTYFFFRGYLYALGDFGRYKQQVFSISEALVFQVLKVEGN